MGKDVNGHFTKEHIANKHALVTREMKLTPTQPLELGKSQYQVLVMIPSHTLLAGV